MIEDELRDLLAPNTDIPVFARYLPPELPQCYCIQEIGGRTSNANLRRAVHFISVMACASRLEEARVRLNYARDFYTTQIPLRDNGTVTTINQHHYYTAVPMAEGKIIQKAARGPVFILHAIMEVTRQL